MIPRLISGWPMRAVSAAMRSVQAIASSQPPPRQKPLIAAITGLPMFSIRSRTCCPRCACSLPCVGLSAASSLMSAPAMNAFSPAPVTITTRTDASCFRCSTACRSSSVVGVSRALRTAGRLMVRIATAPSRSRRRLSKVIDAASRNYTPRPTGKQRDGGAERIRVPIGDIRGTPGHEPLMNFVGDPIERGERETDERLPKRDARLHAAGQRTRNHQSESQVTEGMRRLVGNTRRQRRLMQGRQVKDRGHIERDRTPESDDAAVIQNAKFKMQTRSMSFAFRILNFALQREEVQDPAEGDASDDERREELRAEPQLLLRLVAHQRAEHNRDEQREDNHQPEVRRHFRPCATSK